MSFQVPEIVRIKRRITDDPVQRLVFEDSRKLKRQKSSNFLFTLARTDEKNQENETVLQYSEESSKRKIFQLPRSGGVKKQRMVDTKVQDATDIDLELDDTVPEELADMLKEYLTMEKGGNQNETARYVYDVYYRQETASVEAGSESLTSATAVIRFATEDLELLHNEEESEPEHFSDDEDSNTEDFYRNDYPEHEQEDDTEAEFGFNDDDEDDDDNDDNEYDDDDNDEFGNTSVIRTLQRKTRKEIESKQLSIDDVDHLYEKFYGSD